VHRPGPRRWAATRMGLGVAALALIAGCSTPDPTPPPSSTTSPVGSSSSTTSAASSTSTATGSATTAASDMPEAARANTPDGAVAFTDYFFRQTNLAYSSLDRTKVDGLFVAECQTCQNMVTTLDKWKAQNYRYQGQYSNISYITPSAFDGNGAAKVVAVNRAVGESKLLDSNSGTVQTFPAQSGNLSVALQYSGGMWQTVEIKVAA
jgi:hypothetical protein